MKFSFNVIFVVKFHPIHFSKRFYQNALAILEKYKNSKKIHFYNFDELKKVKKYKHLNDKDGDIIKQIKNFNKDFNKKVELYMNTDLIISFFSTINLEAAFFKIPSINFLEKNIKLKSSSTNKKEVDLGVNVLHIQRSIINKSLTLVLGYKNLENKINFLINNNNVNENILKNEINNLNERPIKKVMQQIDKLI